VESVTPDGYEIIETPLPSLVTVSSELGQLRSVTLREILAAQQKPITTWNAEKLGIGLPFSKRVGLVNLYIPLHESCCDMIEGSTTDELGVRLAIKLKEKELF